ncbi:MAG: GtrA family protein [Candidatus Uhrbacteria bacterium]
MKIGRDSISFLPAFFRYAVIGVGNTILNFAMYTAMTRGSDFWMEHYLLANVVTFCTIVTWSFFWNKRWSFKNHEQQHGVQYAKFVLVTVGGIAIEQSVLVIGVELFSVLDIFAKLIAGPIVVLWNFGMYRRWAFSTKETSVGVPMSDYDLSVEDV